MASLKQIIIAKLIWNFVNIYFMMPNIAFIPDFA